MLLFITIFPNNNFHVIDILPCAAELLFVFGHEVLRGIGTAVKVPRLFHDFQPAAGVFDI